MFQWYPWKVSTSVVSTHSPRESKRTNCTAHQTARSHWCYRMVLVSESSSGKHWISAFWLATAPEGNVEDATTMVSICLDVGSCATVPLCQMAFARLRCLCRWFHAWNANGILQVPSGNLTELWKITIWVGKSPINGPFSIDMLNYQGASQLGHVQCLC